MDLMVPRDFSSAGLFYYFGTKVFYAVVCGGLIGLERELKQKSAGLKTNILICLGAAIYTAISIVIWAQLRAEHMMGDPSRVAAQIVSGIGFLGGGAIIQSRGNVYGMTTAANIWVVAALGICVGTGHAEIAVFTALMVVILLIGATFIEGRILGRVQVFMCQVVLDDPDSTVRSRIYDLLQEKDLFIDDFNMVQVEKNRTEIQLRYRGSPVDHKGFLIALWGMPQVKEVKQE